LPLIAGLEQNHPAKYIPILISCCNNLCLKIDIFFIYVTKIELNEID